MRRIAVGITIAGMILSACSGNSEGELDEIEAHGTEESESEPEPQPEPEPEPEPEAEPEPRPANVRYDSVYDLRERVEEAGVACEDWAIISNPDGAIERATCTSAIVVSIHENASQVQQSVDFTAEISLAFDLPSHHVVGPNWSVNCSSHADVCIALRESLGGEVDSREP